MGEGTLLIDLNTGCGYIQFENNKKLLHFIKRLLNGAQILSVILYVHDFDCLKIVFLIIFFYFYDVSLYIISMIYNNHRLFFILEKCINV